MKFGGENRVVNKRKNFITQTYVGVGALFFISFIVFGVSLMWFLSKPTLYEREVVFKTITYENIGGENPQYHIRVENNNTVYRVDAVLYPAFPINDFNSKVNTSDVIILGRVHIS